MFSLFLLYIDPGTGSLLFSLFAGISAAFVFLFRSLIIKLKTVIQGKKYFNKNSSMKYVIYCEGSQYWNVFKPVVEQFEKNKTELHYLTSSPDDPFFNIKWNYVKGEYIGEGNKAYSFLNILSARIVLMTTPGLDVYQIKRSKNVRHYSHILHAVTGGITYRLFGLDYFDSVLLTGDFQAADIRCLEKLRGIKEKQLVTVGCTYLDEYSQKISAIKKENNPAFTVLVSPSWGTSALLKRCGEKLLDPLCDSAWRIIIRPHPQSLKSELDVLEKLRERYKNNSNLIWDYDRENINSLFKADIMISDFSGIIFDYMHLFDRPFIYLNQEIDLRPYDADDIDHELWHMETFKKTGVEITENDLPLLKEIINSINEKQSLSSARQKEGNDSWQYRGEAGKRVYDFLTGIVDGN